MKKLLFGLLLPLQLCGYSVHDLAHQNFNKAHLSKVGTHIVAELEGCQVNTNNIEELNKVLRTAATDAGATVLSVSSHQFEPQGVTGVAVLQESHISIHTWPEHGYVALDIFTCGDHVIIDRAFEILKEFFQPTHVSVIKLKRGMDKTVTPLDG